MKKPLILLSYPFVASQSCPDVELGEQCELQCEIDFVLCSNDCSNSSCLTECARILSTCSASCPCSEGCPDGCDGCSNPICVCNANPTPQNEENYKNCLREKSDDLGQCILDCQSTGSQTCKNNCVSDFERQHESCPCQDACPYGCPCDDFECEPDKKSILVLNTWSRDGPVLIKNDGGEDTNLDFTFGPGTSADKSCAAILNGEFYVFGGEDGTSFLRQISKINGCSLERIADLPKEFKYGACGTYNFPEERVMFCFGSTMDQEKQCFSYNGQNYRDHPDSRHPHARITLGNIQNQVFAVGSGGPVGTYNTQAESFDIQSNTWQLRAKYPYCENKTFAYATVNRGDSILLIGGACDGDDSSRIAKYTFDKWTTVGNLQTSRRGHRAIADKNGRVFVVGGQGHFASEIWAEDKNDETVNIKQVQPMLDNYSFYPELFTVPSNFCTK